MVMQTFYSSSPSSMSSPSPSCPPLYTPRPAWSCRLSTPHHHHQCHHRHHHAHLFTLLDRHGHADFLLLITIINVITVTIMSTSLHSSTGMVMQTFYSSSPSSMSSPSPSCPPLC